jgi:hypothetical protein
MKKLILIAGLAALGVLAAPPLAAAEERSCRGTLGAITVDNLRVPQGAKCILKRTRVEGTIKVQRRAVLVANRVRVIGNVQGEGARWVTVRYGSRVNGSIQVVQGGGAGVLGSRIGGTLLYDENRRALRAARNAIKGDLQAFQNSGGVWIARNRIDGNLQCKANRPRPRGFGNIVQGNKEDQCARL